MHYRLKYIILSLFLGSTVYPIHAQTGINDTIRVYGIVEGRDTLPLFYINDVLAYGEGRVDPDREKYWRRLRYNVNKVYPLAIKASKILNEVDEDLAGVTSKRERKKYLKRREEQLKDQYKKELKDLTVTQGKILVKLINRQTGKDAYSVIKELRGGLKARASQTAAYFFDNNLKAIYDPYNEDKDIEAIVQEIESKGYYR